MATTDLFVEILMIGAIANVWVCLILLAILSPTTALISSIVHSMGEVSTLLILPFLAVTYVLGWTINFLADYLFRRLFQRGVRDRIVEEACLKDKGYHYIRSFFSQKASDKLVQDWDYTRHSIRLARSSALNFIAMACALLLHLNVHRLLIMIGAGFCVVIAILAYWQASTLSRSNYRRLIEVYKMLREENKNSETDKPQATPDSAH